MDIQHAVATSIWHIRTLNNQNWISFLVFARRICILLYRGDFLAWVFEGVLGKSGRGGASGLVWKRIVPPQIKGSSPHALPHTLTLVFWLPTPACRVLGFASMMPFSQV